MFLVASPVLVAVLMVIAELHLAYTYREQSTCHAGGEHCTTDSMLSLDVLVFLYESVDRELITSEYERKGRAEKLPLPFLFGYW